MLKGQLAQLAVSGAVNAGGVELVTRARPPRAPSSPRPVRDSLLGLIIGLLLGIGAAFVVEHVDDSLHLAEEVERLTPGAPSPCSCPDGEILEEQRSGRSL